MERQRLILLVLITTLVATGGFLIFNLKIAPNKNFAFLGGIGEVEIKPLVLSQEDISNITRPTVVRIFNHVSGKLVIPFFDIDWTKLDIVFYPNQKPIEYPVDEYMSGSGFVVSKDGYILTNAHVVSSYTFKRAMAQQLIALRFLEALLQSSQAAKQFDAALRERGINPADEYQFRQFGEELALYLGEKLADKIISPDSQKVVVLNPFSTGDNISQLLENGFPAKIISVNNDFFKDEKDIAILKISESRLPSLNLGDVKKVNTGNKIYVYGFPSTGQFNAKDILEPTFTQGTISGLKDSKTGAFKVFQTDAKVSTGSSGGPLLNDQGEVMGLVTFATGADAVGDAFAFAIPADLAKKALEEAKIVIEESSFIKSFKSGILNLQNKRCKKAIQDFDAAKQINANFFADKYIQPYIDSCNALIASGQSIDSQFDELKIWARGLGNLFWFLLGGGVGVIAIIVFVMIVLIKMIKKEEKEIAQLEDIVETRQNKIAERNDLGPIEDDSVNDNLLNYVRSARDSGMDDGLIEEELKKAGWPEDMIRQALMKIP